MVSEFLRDAAVFVLVFALLDKVVGKGHALWWNVAVTAIIVAISAGLLFWGIRVEEGQAPAPAEEVGEEDDQ